MARGTNKLAALQVKNSGPGTLQDGGGLMLTKRDKDSGKWTFRYSFAGRRRDMGLGAWPDVSLARARSMRDEWRAEIANGKDPISERDKRLQETKDAMDKDDPTFEGMTEITFDAIKSDLRGKGDRGRWKSPLRVHIFPKIGKTRISKIRPIDVRDAMSPIWRTKPETARKAFTRTRKVFDKAARMEFEVYPNLMDIAEEMLGSAPIRNNTPTPATPWKDLPALYDRLRWDLMSHLALRFTILTVVRTDAIRGACFSEIDGETWTIPSDRIKGREGKVDEFRVPLSTEAMKIVEHCREFKRSDLLFPSPHGNGKKPLSENAMLNALNEMDESGRPHGFRASFKTWSEETDLIGWDVSEVSLGHVIKTSVQRAYGRSDLLERRRVAMQKWADFVTGTESKVVPLRGSQN
ncbi:MAG: integrase arm-type DNA-binding domain-containing protein [Pseudomonadota bacterium]